MPSTVLQETQTVPQVAVEAQQSIVSNIDLNMMQTEKDDVEVSAISVA